MIVGIGIDIVDLARFERAVSRTPALRDRLFAPSERDLPLPSLAGRFAAKEALIKALGDSTGVTWHDMEVVSDDHGNPDFVLHGAVADILERRGITALHLSMSHDAGVAIANVIAESDGPPVNATPFREARIDTDALRNNFEILRSRVAPAAAMAVVKADAYGHGMILVARAAVEAGAEWLGVTDLAEAMALRSAGIREPVLAWLHGTDADFESAIAAGVDLGLSSLDQLERAAVLGGAVVQLKVDTGLSRNGIAPDDVQQVFARAAELERAGRVRIRGVFSHLSNTSRADDTRQLEVFDRVLEVARSAGLDPELRHIASSQAAIERPEARFDLVRLGVALYGLPPADTVDTAALGLRPVMELAGSIAAVRRVPAGSGVSYGFTHRTQRDTTLALVPLGYADGVPRAASGRGRVWIGGSQYPVVGRIAMDQFIVDVGDDEVAVGDRVVVWGDPATGVPGAEDWARAAGTIGYEIVTRVGPRVPRTSRP